MMQDKNNELKPCPFKKGDIVKNGYAGKQNPNRYLMFVKCSVANHMDAYDFMNHCGHKVQQLRFNEKLEKVGHIDEYDDFLYALKKLQSMGQEESTWRD